MNMGSKPGGHMVDLLFALALFCMFAASALVVVLIGANVYKSTVAQMDNNFAARTSLTYVTTKIRQNDTQGAAYLTLLGESNALVLEQSLNGTVYQTWIYYYDGSLRETFIKAGNEVNPADGQMILEVADFTISQAQSPDSFQLASKDKDGNIVTQWVTPRCGVANEKGGAA